MRQPLPFPEVAGAAWSKRALLLVAVDPQLGGVLIAGPPGTAKSLLARSLASLCPNLVIAPCTAAAEDLEGGLDLERTLAAGRRIHSPGLLARACGGFLLVDEVNRLGPTPAALIATGIPGFALVATYDPAAGPIHPALRAAAGLHVVQEPLALSERIELLGRMRASGSGLRIPARPSPDLQTRIHAARERLPEIELPDGHRLRLVEQAEKLGVADHRADLYAARAARASAALRGSPAVEEEDLEAAVRLVLEPRAKEAGGPAPPGRTAAQVSNLRPTSQDVILPALETALACDPLHIETASGQRGRTVRTTARKSARVALEATLRAAAPHQQGRPPAGIRVEPRDLRYRECRVRRGALVVFALDLSGSMARNRIQQAKGAILSLLDKAHLRRDKVALITFRGSRAELALEPSGSLQRARRVIGALPAGGGTPLAAGLVEALKLARRDQRKENRKSVLVLLTDGEPNVALGAEDVWRELDRVCAAIRAEGLAGAVVDTRRGFEAPAGAARLAAMLGARLIRLGGAAP